jgi:fatty acid desaturase
VNTSTASSLPATPIPVTSLDGARTRKPPVDFSILAARVRAAGLLDKRPGWYALRIALTILALAFSITWIVIMPSLWMQIPNALFLAVVMGQAAMLGHDAGHRQVSRTGWKNAAIGLSNNLIVGGSWTWWVWAHDRHHGKPNQIGEDPATAFDMIAMTPEQAASKSGFARFMVKYQAFFIIPLMSLYGISMRIDSAGHILSRRARRPLLEASLIAVSFVAWIGGLVLALGWWQAIVFLAVNQLAFGLYVASVFLPNHHGMPVLDEGEDADFVRHQVVTARNIEGGRFIDFWFGGLNHQIEHHLFPTAPRGNLRAIRKHVREFCAEHAIPYHSTGVLRSFRDVFTYLHEVSAPARLRPVPLADRA